MSEHCLKTWPEYFNAVKSGEKTFEVRKNDRDFRVGDVLLLEEYTHGGAFTSGYTGRVIRRVVTYVLSSQDFCPPGHVVLGIKELDADRRAAITADIPLDELEALCNAWRDGRVVVLPPLVDENYSGLKVKYRVFKARNGEPVEDCFVLRPDIDMAARSALRCYADDTPNRELARDILTWLDNIGERKTREVAEAALRFGDCPYWSASTCTGRNCCTEKDCPQFAQSQAAMEARG